MKKILLAEIVIILIAVLLVIALSYWAFQTDKFLPKASTPQSQNE
jgi:uncharacterized membrane protein YwzB